jgi:ABC-type multidrug transport system fused ATPase/permease subunit
MYRNYLYKDYSFFLENNSSKLVSNIIIEVEKFAYRVVDAMIIILTESFVVIAILSFLLLNYFSASFILSSVIGIFFIFFYKLYKSKFKKLGEIKTYHDSEKINDLQKSFYVVQNIKLDNLENFFSKKFKKNNTAGSDSYFLLQFFGEIPKPLIELFVLLIIFIIMYFSYYHLSFSKNDILIMIGIYGVAMFRLLPSCNRILNCTNQVRYFFSTIETVSNEIQKKDEKEIKYDKKSPVHFSFKNSIDFQDVVFSYPNSEKKILDKDS